MKVLLMLILFSSSLIANWQLPYFGNIVGSWESSVGLHMWGDHIHIRNWQFRNSSYILPGIKAHTIIRSNRSFDSISEFDPVFDELYLEGFGFYLNGNHQFSVSNKVGRSRYLRFPYPDRISEFDQVPGTEDLRLGQRTGYHGWLTILDYAYKKTIGIHYTQLIEDPLGTPETKRIESYLYLHKNIKNCRLELRHGTLAKRPEPLGDSALGFSAYLGLKFRGCEVGALYENKEDRPIYTGILVQFNPSKFKELAGKLRLDYTRKPEGIVIQPTLIKGSYGYAKEVPDNASYLGSIFGKRVITYWQNGQGRNYYEHLIPSDQFPHIKPGEKIIVVQRENSWNLELESLVSPHNQFKDWDDLVKWEKRRQGPAQLTQEVLYELYRVGE